MVTTRLEEERLAAEQLAADRLAERLAAERLAAMSSTTSTTGNTSLTVNTNVNLSTGNSNTNLPSPPPPSLTPFGKTIDLTTESGRKYYIDATKELSIKFDGSKQKYHSFILCLKYAANERGWDKICDLTYNGVKFNLLMEPGKIPLPDLKLYSASIWSGKNYQVQQLHNIMGVCLLKSVEERVRNRLDLDKSTWFFTVRGGSDGLLILKLLINYSMQSTRYGIQTTKNALHTLKISSYENNVTTMLLGRRNLIDELAAHGEKFAEDLFWLYKSLETCENKSFLRWLEGEKSLWEQGKSSSLTSEELQEEADTRYRHLVDSNKWDEDSQGNKKLIAMHAVVTELVKTLALQATATNPKHKGDKDVERFKEKNAWKQIEPKEGESKTKTVGDKTYHWCTGHEGVAHRKMWSMHAPNECSIEKSKEKRPAGAGKTAPAKEGTTKKNPTLQPNSSLQHALTALTKMFPGGNSASADTGADAYGLDF